LEKKAGPLGGDVLHFGQKTWSSGEDKTRLLREKRKKELGELPKLDIDKCANIVSDNWGHGGSGGL